MMSVEESVYQVNCENGNRSRPMGMNWKPRSLRLPMLTRLQGIRATRTQPRCTARIRLSMQHKLGEVIFGAGWQSELARHIGVDSRQVRRWVAGDTPTPRLLLLYLGLLASLGPRTRKRWLKENGTKGPVGNKEEA